MEPVLSDIDEQLDHRTEVVLESTITVPTEHLPWLVAALRKGGIDAWDTGERTTTEDALEALADVRVRVRPA